MMLSLLFSYSLSFQCSHCSAVVNYCLIHFAVYVAFLWLCGSEGVVEHGLWAIGNLADSSDENRTLLGTAGACEGE